MAGCGSGCVWYVNWPEGSKVKLVSGHAHQLVGVASSSDGRLFATACQDGSVTVWNRDSLEQTVVFHAPKKVCSGTPRTEDTSLNTFSHPKYHSCMHFDL